MVNITNTPIFCDKLHKYIYNFLELKINSIICLIHKVKQ